MFVFWGYNRTPLWFAQVTLNSYKSIGWFIESRWNTCSSVIYAARSGQARYLDCWCLLVFAGVCWILMAVEKKRRRGLSSQQLFFCGLGHVINDNTRRMLHSFRMIFLMRVVGISATNAGLISSYNYFVGGIIFAPVAGFLCDKIKIPVLSRRHGKRKSWHLIGSLAAAISIPLFFSKCFVCGSGTSDWVLLLYYFFVATIISFSINFVDISHLSVIPVLAKNQSEVAKLTSLRFGNLFQSLNLLLCWISWEDSF